MEQAKRPNRGTPLQASPITGQESTESLLQNCFLAYGGREVRQAYQLLKRAISENHLITVTLSGAMTPADIGRSCLNVMIERGMTDILCTTGANLYHDLHRSLGFILEEGTPWIDDRELRQERTIRIYDIFFHEEVLLQTDLFFASILQGEEFQRSMTTPEFHHLLGKYVYELENRAGITNRSVLSTCYLHQVPVFCGAPQDGSIFLNVVKLRKQLGDDFRFNLDLVQDVFEFAAYQYYAKKQSPGRMAVLILGGGVPKNYTLQGEPLLSQIFGLEIEGYDIDIQISDANVHTGGLSGCPASEGHTWGKTSSECVINSVFCHGDVTQLLPVLVHAAAQQGLNKDGARLLSRRREMLAFLEEAVDAARAGGTSGAR